MADIDPTISAKAPKPPKPPTTVVVQVNGRSVTLEAGVATGIEIKQAAIAQGAHIQENFVLQQELANGSSQIVGDHDEVKLREHMRFTAIAPDDNS